MFNQKNNKIKKIRRYNQNENIVKHQRKITDGYKKYKKLLENLPQNMIHLPIIDRIYMNEVFNICDVLFMPSFIELFPMTILEACNVHKPFLVRDLDLYKPILFERYCRGKNVVDFNNELKKLKNDVSNLIIYI